MHATSCIIFAWELRWVLRIMRILRLPERDFPYLTCTRVSLENLQLF